MNKLGHVEQKKEYLCAGACVRTFQRICVAVFEFHDPMDCMCAAAPVDQTLPSKQCFIIEQNVSGNCICPGTMFHGLMSDWFSFQSEWSARRFTGAEHPLGAWIVP